MASTHRQDPHTPLGRTEGGLLLELCDSLTRFDEVARAWDSLVQSSSDQCPFARHACQRAWIRAFAAERPLRIPLVWRGDELVGGAAFVIGQSPLLGRKRKTTRLLGNAWTDRAAVLLAQPNEPALRLIIEAAGRADGDSGVLDFHSLSDDSATARLLPTVAAHEGFWHGYEESYSSPYMPLPDSWEKLLDQLSPTMRANVRRKLRKAEQAAGATMEIVRDGSCLATIAEISPFTWQGEEGTAMNSQADVWEMYQALVLDAAQHGCLVCGVLSLHGRPIAFDLNVRVGSVLYSLKLGFRADQAALSPGIAIKAFLLRHEIEHSSHRLTEYDFMGTNESYKMQWSSSVRRQGRHLLFRPRLGLAIPFAAKYRVKPFLKVLSPGLVSLMRRLRQRSR